MDNKLAVIGVGQVGSRHLQALGKVSGINKIFLVDTNPDSRKTAVSRFKEMNPDFRGRLQELENIDKLPEELDVAVIATTADVRLIALKHLLRTSNVKSLILEKVLFQNLNDYFEAERILGEVVTRTWVNCPQRIWPFFKDLRDRFASDPNLQLIVHGSQWGLACNAVHNADIAAFLWGNSLQHEPLLDPDFIDSKRAGFKEVTGEFVTRAGRGRLVRQLSYENGRFPLCFTVHHPNAHIIWNAVSGARMESNEAQGWGWEASMMRAPYQSELTTLIVEDILAGRLCGLPEYRASASIHRGVLEAIIKAARLNGKELNGICPIT
jgi:hypothetical protein